MQAKLPLKVLSCKWKRRSGQPEDYASPVRLYLDLSRLAHKLTVASLTRLRYGSQMKSGDQRRKPAFGKDKRRKHRHYQVTAIYRDGEKFARVYTDRVKADKFAERQRKSPIVKGSRVTEVGG